MSQNRPAAFSSLRMGEVIREKVPRWSDGRNSRHAIYTMQDRGKWFLWCGLSNQVVTFGRRCCHQTCFARQEIQEP
ncbi:hypothetical protein EYC84_011737 [Monilinia fructicola]|uniref:Uncharacterized protein n=1 Tax=Monilinia fructicola TaxID=38448 RepID=A0A5M9J3U4_MONFR|nr:hypothetical protein EYC84_011737 [Monilinia fructicola]